MDWDKEFKKIKSFEKVDDVDLYSKYEYSELMNLRKEYLKKNKYLKKNLNITLNKITKLKELINLLNQELSIIIKKLDILKRKKNEKN